MHENEAMSFQRGEEMLVDKKERKLIRWRIVQQSQSPNPRPRHGHRAILIGNLIVVIGGGNEGMIDQLHIYNLEKREWIAPQIRGEIPRPAAAFGACLVGNNIYTFGGMVEYGRYSNDLYELQTDNFEWRRLNPQVSNGEEPPAPRLGHSFVASQKAQKAYVFGGLVNDLNDNKRNVPRYMDDFYVLDFSGTSLRWEKPVMTGLRPSGRESHTAVIYETDTSSTMIVYGGMNGVRLNDVWYLDLKTYEWTEMKTSGIAPLPRSLHTSVLIGDKMYVFGGWVPLVDQSHSSDQQAEKEWKCTNSVGCWSIAENRWIPLELYSSDEDHVPRARSGHCAVAVGDRMYIWSGRDGYRKAWSNQVCCRDMWYLDTVKPNQPEKVQLTRAGFSAFELTWPPVPGATGYFLQFGFDGTKDSSVSPTKRSPQKQANPAKETIDSPSKKSGGSTPSVISTQGTTYTAPAASKPTADEGALPQDLFEDTEKNEAAPSSPKVGEQETKIENSSGGDNEKTEEKKSEEADKPLVDNEFDDMTWFDVGIIEKNEITVTHCFNDRQPPLEDQLRDLLQHNAFKCVNDKCFLPEDKVPILNGQSYRFRVSAINGLGRGSWSEPVSFKTCVPGFPSAPSSIRITKSMDGAQLTWEPPANANVSGKIVEYSVYLAVKNQSANSVDSQLAFMRVYCGQNAECQVPQANLGTAYVDQTNKPAIIFRIAAKNEKGYGPATQVRWLQDQQKIPVRANYPPTVNTAGFLYQHVGPQKRPRFEHQ